MTRPGVPEGSSPILVVDHREDSLVAYRAALEPLGQPIVAVHSADEALRWLLRNRPAVILLDVYMPGLDGFAAARLIKGRRRTRDIPIIFLTADERAGRQQIELGYSAGAVDFLVTPFSPRALRSKVGTFVELATKNLQLERQVNDLSRSRASLAEASRIARLAHWEVVVERERAIWSEQMYTLLRLPEGAAAPSVRDVFPYFDEILDSLDGLEPFVLRTQLRRADGTVAEVIVRAERVPDKFGRLTRVAGTVQDITAQENTRRALNAANDALAREHEAVLVLQESMIPGVLANAPGVDIAARYIPAEIGVGGDWYDAWWQPDGDLLLVIGDVAGHGLAASATMNEIRIAARAFATNHATLTALFADLAKYVTGLLRGVMATALAIRLDPVTGDASVISAGHLAPLLDDCSGPRYLDIPVGPPLGYRAGIHEEASFHLPPGGRLLLFTDGLVEARGEPIDDRLEELRATTTAPTEKAEQLIERVLAAMIETASPPDDIALLAAQRFVDPDLLVTVPAEPSRLATLRIVLRRWLEAAGASTESIQAIVLAAGELMANVCIHAYPLHDGDLHLHASVPGGGLVRVEVHDSGTWRPQQHRGGGRGLVIAHAAVDELSFETGEGGTRANICHRLFESTPRDAGDGP